MRQWIEQARSGDAAAWEQIVKHFREMAITVAYAKLGDWCLAEDTVQEAFTEAYTKIGQLQNVEAFPGWFKKIVERQCNRHFRRKKHLTTELNESIVMDQEHSDAALIAERKEQHRKLHQSVESLSAPLKLAVQLYYLQGYSIGEISGFLSVSPSALKKRLFDARHKLRASLLVADFVSMFRDIYEGGEAMLHIVNGDHVGDKLKAGNISGDILVWREIYPVGPVALDISEHYTQPFRSAYLEKTLGVPQEDYVRSLKSQEQTLRGFQKYDEVVLWFEHDLFDQLMLSCLLHWFAARPLGRTKLSLLCIGNYPGIDDFRGLGQLTTKQLETLSGTWQPIGQPELETGQTIWEAYTSPSIERHVEISETDTSALPFAQAALQLHLSRLPSVANGLGIVEQTALELVGQGINTPRRLFKEVGKRLNGLGMGDLEFWYRLKQLSEQPNAMLELRSPPSAADSLMSLLSKDQGEIALTQVGKDALAGSVDIIKLKGIDEWYGGLRLHGRLAWRWDQAAKRLVYME